METQWAQRIWHGAKLGNPENPWYNIFRKEEVMSHGHSEKARAAIRDSRKAVSFFVRIESPKQVKPLCFQKAEAQGYLCYLWGTLSPFATVDIYCLGPHRQLGNARHSHLNRRESSHIRMGNEFCCLHPNQKIRNRSKLHAINTLSQFLGFLEPGAV